MHGFKNSTIALVLTVCASGSLAAPPDFTKVYGFASVDGAGNQTLKGGTTGGAGGSTVKAATAADLIKYLAQEGPLVIQVEGTIELPINEMPAGEAKLYGAYPVTSHKTLVGVGKDPTIKGGGLVVGKVPFDDDVTSPPADAPHNIIIRNLAFDGTGGKSDESDCINIFMHAHHVWIDHCTFRNEADGALDVKRGASYVTVSWNHFFENVKTSLVGHDDGNGAQDLGYLKVTYHHNYWQKTDQRGPRVRFGQVHVVNNYYEGTTNYALGLGVEAQIYSERNSMENGNYFSKDYGGGKMVDLGSIATPTPKPGANLGATGGVTWQPDQYYRFPVNAADSVKALVTAWAGAGKLENPLALPGGSTAVLPGKGQRKEIRIQPGAGTPVYNSLGARAQAGGKLPADVRFSRP